MDKPSFRFNQRQSIAIVFVGTLFGAVAQMLIKTGANNLTSGSPLEMLFNTNVVLGYGLYGIFTMLLILALRDGQLSILYPVISLNYVWVTLLSIFVLREAMNPFKIAGLVLIVAGVALLGKNGKKK